MDIHTRENEVPRALRGVIRHEPWTYGRSVLGAPLEAYGPRSGPVDVLLMAAMHGDESDTTVVLSEALRRVSPGDMHNPVLLCVNPDGTQRGTRCNARGVDLNRNLPSANWAGGTVRYRGHGETAQEIELSPGTEPASEPETLALLEVIERLQPRNIVSLHAPLACIEDPAGGKLAQWAAAKTGLPMVPSVGYPTPGSFGSWCSDNGIGILTWELPPEPLPELIRSHKSVLHALIRGAYPPGIV